MERSEIARLFGVDPSTVSRWRAAGCPCGDDGVYDPEQVREWLKCEKRKPSESIARSNQKINEFYDLLEERVTLGRELGYLLSASQTDAAIELLLFDLQETLSLFRADEPADGAAMMRAVIELLQDQVEAYTDEINDDR